MQEQRYLTVEEIAQEMRVTDETVRRWLRTGQLVGLNLGRKAGWRIERVDLEEFIQRSKVKAA